MAIQESAVLMGQQNAWQKIMSDRLAETAQDKQLAAQAMNVLAQTNEMQGQPAEQLRQTAKNLVSRLMGNRYMEGQLNATTAGPFDTEFTYLAPTTASSPPPPPPPGSGNNNQTGAGGNAGGTGSGNGANTNTTTAGANAGQTSASNTTNTAEQQPANQQAEQQAEQQPAQAQTTAPNMTPEQLRNNLLARIFNQSFAPRPNAQGQFTNVMDTWQHGGQLINPSATRQQAQQPTAQSMPINTPESQAILKEAVQKLLAQRQNKAKSTGGK